MANRQVPASLRGIVRFRTQRVFRLYYECNACTDLGSEWMDESLVITHGYCPCCGLRVEEPYCVEEFETDRPEFDIDDSEGDE